MDCHYLAISIESLHSGTASKLASGQQAVQAFSFIDNLTVVSISMARLKKPAISCFQSRNKNAEIGACFTFVSLAGRSK